MSDTERYSSPEPGERKYFAKDIIFYVNDEEEHLKFGRKCLGGGGDYDETLEFLLYPIRLFNAITNANIALFDRFLKPGDIVRRTDDEGENVELGICRDVNLKADLQICEKNFIIQNVDASRLNATNGLINRKVVYFNNWIGKIRDIEGYVMLKTANGAIIEIELSNWYYRYKDFNSCDPYFIIRATDDCYYVGKVVDLNLFAEYKNYKLLTPDIECDSPDGIYKCLIESIRVEKIFVKWLYNTGEHMKSQSLSDCPSSSFSGDDLKKLQFLHLYEQTEIEIGHTCYLTISENDEILPKEEWLKKQAINCNQILYEVAKKNGLDLPKKRTIFKDDWDQEWYERNVNVLDDRGDFEYYNGNEIDKEFKENLIGNNYNIHADNFGAEILTKCGSSENNSNPNIAPQVGEILATDTMTTYRDVTVVWQSGRIESGICSRDLYPIQNPNRIKLFFPGDFVSDIDHDGLCYGVIQYVNSKENIGHVKWFEIDLKERPVVIDESDCNLDTLSRHKHFHLVPGTVVVNITKGESKSFVGVIIDYYCFDGQIKIRWNDDKISMCWPNEVLEICKPDNDPDTSCTGSSDKVINLPDWLIMEPKNEISFPQFELLKSANPTHKFFSIIPNYKNPDKFHEIVFREHNLLKESLPPGIWVKAYGDRTDLISVMIQGPQNTPYKDVLLMFDIQLDADYPEKPPKCYHNYDETLNPNFSSLGTICIPLFQTKGNNFWNLWGPHNSILQLVISIQELILVPEPFYCDEVFLDIKDTEKGNLLSKKYNKHLISKLIEIIISQLESPTEPFEKEIMEHFRQKKAYFDQFCEWKEIAKEDYFCWNNSCHYLLESFEKVEERLKEIFQ